ncbi:MAG: HAD family hydrolase [Calditrichia bacterium]
MIPISHVVFDIGGVVIRLNHGVVRSRFAERLGIPVEDLNELISTYRIDGDAQSLAARFRIGTIDADTYLEAYLRRFNNQISKRELIDFLCSELGEPIPETLSLLDDLRGKVNVSCFSNSQAIHWSYLIGDYPVMKEFNPAMASHLAGCAKPDPQTYQYIFNQLNAAAEDCLLIDDSKENVASAKAAGMASIWYQSPQQLLTDLNRFRFVKERG